MARFDLIVIWAQGLIALRVLIGGGGIDVYKMQGLLCALSTSEIRDDVFFHVKSIVPGRYTRGFFSSFFIYRSFFVSLMSTRVIPFFQCSFARL